MNAPITLVFAGTTFKSFSEPRGKRALFTVESLAVMLREAPICKSKSEQPLFSTAVFDGDHRSRSRLLEVGAIVGDHDSGTLDLDGAARRLKHYGVAALLVTTFSHEDVSPRWRIVVPLSKPCSAAEHSSLVRALNHMLMGALARESETAAQPWFYGRNGRADAEVRIVDAPYTLDEIAADFSCPELRCGSNRIDQQGSDEDVFEALNQDGEEPGVDDSPEERGRVAEGLRYIPPSCSREIYRNVGMALCSTGWTDWDAIYMNWACGSMHGYSEEKFDESDFLRDAGSFSTDGGIGLGTLYATAAGYGFDTSRRGSATQLADQAREDATDIGNVNRLVRIAAGNLRCISGSDEFIFWDGRRWLADATATQRLLGLMIEVAEEWNRQAADKETEAAQAPSETARASLLKLAVEYRKRYRYCRDRRGLEAMRHLVRQREGISIERSDLDADPYLLGCTNGVVDLRTGELRPHARDEFVLKRCPVSFHPDAKSEIWQRVINEVTGLPVGKDYKARPGVAKYLQRFLGYACTGLTKSQVMAVWVGGGSNGKNLVLDRVMEILGPYAHPVGADVLLDSKFATSGESASPTMAKLHGVRLAVMSETNESEKFDGAKVKRLTGGGAIHARPLHQPPFSYEFSAKLFLMTNAMPNLREVDEAMRGRLHIVSWLRTWNRPAHTDPDPSLPDSDPDLPEALRNEAPGILAWLVRGAVEYFRSGLKPPPEVAHATTSYLAKQGALAPWVANLMERCAPSEGVGATELFSMFQEHCRSIGIEKTLPATATGFGIELSRLGIEKARSAHGTLYGLKSVL